MNYIWEYIVLEASAMVVNFPIKLTNIVIASFLKSLVYIL